MTSDPAPAVSERAIVLALISAVKAGRFDALESGADQWAASAGIQRMMNAIASVFEKHAPQDTMDRFRERLGALMHLAFVEGAAAGVLQLEPLATPVQKTSDGIPADCVVVPREPTQAMMDALARQAQRPTGWHDVYPAMYRALLAAAPAYTPRTDHPDHSAAGNEGEREAIARIVELAIARHGVCEAKLEGTLDDAAAILALRPTAGNVIAVSLPSPPKQQGFQDV